MNADLRYQLRELRKEMFQKDEDMNKIKKNLKYNKYCELEIELETYKRELMRI